ncbi:ankryin, partial [Wolbachia endosymbiont of Drosophila chauvacae]|nr:ankryin [Wolbachia endosymbiont of Drosophila chauvacae]
THENAGYERNIVKIGESEVEIITQNGKRHYTDLTANSNIALIFCTSFGELEVRLYSDKQNENRIRVEARDQGMLKKLKDCGEEIGKNCSLGYHSVYDAIERGYFEKPAPSSRIVQEEKLQNDKWADQVRYTRKNGAQIG